MQKSDASNRAISHARPVQNSGATGGRLRCLIMLAAVWIINPANIFGADTADPVLSLMLEKGMITEDEAAKVQSQMDAQHTNPAAQFPDSKWKISTGIKDLEIYGDLRSRFEDRSAQDPSGGSIDLQRFRYAARIGLRGEVADDFYYGFRLDTSSNPRSSWVTMGTSSTASPYQGPFGKSNAGINIGQLYLGWHPESWADFTVGKMPNPLYTTPMVWSPTINPEGLAERFKYTAGQVDFFATSAQFLYQDANPISASPDLGLGYSPGAGQMANNIFLIAWQGGLTYHITTNLSVKAAATFYEYYGQEQPSTTSTFPPYFGSDYVGEGAYTGPGSASPVNGYSGYPTASGSIYSIYGGGFANNQTGINDLQVLEIPFEINFRISRWDARIFGDGAYNFQGSQRADAAAAGYAAYLANQTQPSTIKAFSPQTGENKAYQIGFALGGKDSLGLVNGATSHKNAWEVRAYWQHVEQYSLDPNLVDTDFMEGLENLQGIYAAAAYGFSENIIGTFRYGYASRINNKLGTGGSGQDIPEINPVSQFQLFQVDLTFKF